MKLVSTHKRLFLLIAFILASCAAPDAPTPTQIFTQEPVFSTSTALIPVTPDPEMGKIAGNISWFDPVTSTNLPIGNVNLQIDGHSSSAPKYKARTDANGNYSFVNIEPVNYGFGIYFSVPIDERRCEDPEFLFDVDLKWLHYATAKGSAVFDIIFSSKDIVVDAGEIVVLDFVLKCP